MKPLLRPLGAAAATTAAVIGLLQAPLSSEAAFTTNRPIVDATGVDGVFRRYQRLVNEMTPAKNRSEIGTGVENADDGDDDGIFTSCSALMQTMLSLVCSDFILSVSLPGCSDACLVSGDFDGECAVNSTCYQCASYESAMFYNKDLMGRVSADFSSAPTPSPTPAPTLTPHQRRALALVNDRAGGRNRDGEGDSGHRVLPVVTPAPSMATPSPLWTPGPTPLWTPPPTLAPSPSPTPAGTPSPTWSFGGWDDDDSSAGGCTVDDINTFLDGFACCLEQYTGGCLTDYYQDNYDLPSEVCAPGCPASWDNDGECDCTCINESAGCDASDCSSAESTACTAEQGLVDQSVETLFYGCFDDDFTALAVAAITGIAVGSVCCCCCCIGLVVGIVVACQRSSRKNNAGGSGPGIVVAPAPYAIATGGNSAIVYAGLPTESMSPTAGMAHANPTFGGAGVPIGVPAGVPLGVMAK